MPVPTLTNIPVTGKGDAMLGPGTAWHCPCSNVLKLALVASWICLTAVTAQSTCAQPSLPAKLQNTGSGPALPPGTVEPPGSTEIQDAHMNPAEQLPGEPAASNNGNAPIVVPPLTFVDINSGSFGKLEIDLQEASFQASRVENLHLVARNMDIKSGTLDSLTVTVEGGHLRDFIFDRLALDTKSPLNFETGSFLNKRMLEFLKPAQAQVSVVISQQSLNSFLQAQATRERLSCATTRRIPLLSTLCRQDIRAGLQVTGASLALSEDSHMQLALDCRLGIGLASLTLPVSLQTRLGLENGWVHLSETRLITAGQEIAPDLSATIVERVNNLTNWGQGSSDIQFQFTDLKVIPGEQLQLTGTASVSRLRFGSLEQRANESTEQERAAGQGQEGEPAATDSPGKGQPKTRFGSVRHRWRLFERN